MNIRISLLLILLSVLSSCRQSPSNEIVNNILQSDEFKIKVIHRHGNIMGKSRKTRETEFFKLKRTQNGISAKYTYIDPDTDEEVEVDFMKSDIDSLLLIMKVAVQYHDPDKEYSGCCMCHEMDFKLKSGNLITILKPFNYNTDSLYNGLTRKYKFIKWGNWKNPYTQN